MRDSFSSSHGLVQCQKKLAMLRHKIANIFRKVNFRGHKLSKLQNIPDPQRIGGNFVISNSPTVCPSDKLLDSRLVRQRDEMFKVVIG